MKTIVATEAIRIPSGDPVSIGSLIREQSSGSPLPELPLYSIHFIPSFLSGDLIFPPTRFVPEGFTWGVQAGKDLKIKVTKIPLNGLDALDFFLVTTNGNYCDLFLIMEF
jgi:hypothetical protein